MAHRVLLVEDDLDVSNVVGAYLRREGYDVETVHDGVTGLERALEAPPDLIVLDWLLPGLDGLGVLQRLRREARTPVIMLTARGEEADRILGLEHGADDYVPKPFSPRELVARVRAVLRRAYSEDPAPQPLIEHRGLIIDPSQRRVRRGDRSIDVTTLEFDLLYALARAPGRVFSRQDLLDRVWGDDFIAIDRVVDVHISNLRQKLAELAADTYITTIRGIGYRLD